MHGFTMLCLAAADAIGVTVGAAASSRAAPIVNGQSTAEFPTAAVISVGGDDPRVCSGVLIGCSTILTAAHCLTRDGSDLTSDVPVRPEDVTVFLEHAGFFQAARISLHPQFSFPFADVAIAQLEAPVNGIAPSRLARSAPGSRTPSTVVGFGTTGDPESGIGIKRAGAVTTTPCPAAFRGLGLVCWAYSGTQATTCDGDSGGPLFLLDGRLAGVSAGGTSPGCLPGDIAIETSVARHRSWIESTAAGDTRTRRCGDLPAVGTADVRSSAVQGSLATAGESRTHEFWVPGGVRELRIGLHGLDRGDADFDLFVHGPSPGPPECSDNRPGQYGFCTVAAPDPGRWSIVAGATEGDGPYQLTVAAFGGEPPVCGNDRIEVGEQCDGVDRTACPDSCVNCRCLSCDPAGFTVDQVQLSPSLFLQGTLSESTARYLLNPTTVPLTLQVADGSEHWFSITIPAGDAGWRHSGRRGYRWLGQRDGLRRMTIRKAFGTAGWRVQITGRHVPGADRIGLSRLQILLAAGATCGVKQFGNPSPSLAQD